MKNWCLTGLAVAVIATLSIGAAGAQRNTQADAMMAAAQQKESVEGDLPAAIKQYRDIAARFAKTDPRVAASALVRAADAYRTMGDPESRKLYQQVIKEYPNQAEAVTRAKLRLGVDTPAGPVLRTVMTAKGDYGSLSRDGRFISYRNAPSIRNGPSGGPLGDIFIYEIATGMDWNITNRKDLAVTRFADIAGKDRVFESLISPDGKQIAYVWQTGQNKRYTLRLANLTGSPNPRTLYDNSEVSDLWAHDWSPDSRFLAVSLLKVDKSAQIALVSVSSGSLQPLHSLDWRGIGRMRFSPDGKYLVYDRPQGDTKKEKDIFVLSLDGSRLDRVVENDSNDELVGWSPDGKWILFSSDRAGTIDLWAVPFKDGEATGRAQQLVAKSGNFYPLGWSPSGALYYHTTQGGGTPKRTLQLASLDWSTNQISVVPLGTRGYQENTFDSAWSPDGKSLVYLSRTRENPSNEVPMLMIRATDNGRTRELRVKQLSRISNIEAWSPDSLSVFVRGNDTGGEQLDIGNGLYRVDVETGDTTVIIRYDQYDPEKVPLTSGVQWLTDGFSFVTRVSGPKVGTYRVDSRTGIMTKVESDEAASLNRTLSPDGKAAYSRQVVQTPQEGREGVIAFIKHDLATGKETELIRRSFLGNIHLSRDGQHIATASTDRASNSRVVLLIPIAGGGAHELMRVPSELKIEDLDNPNQGQLIGIVSGWVSDGQSLLVQKNSSDRTKERELWLVSLNGGAPKRVVDGNLPPGAVIWVSPDGLSFVYSSDEPAPAATQVIMALENFLPKSTK